MGNISASIKKRNLVGTARENTIDLTMSSSYATNGDVLPSNAALGLDNSLDSITIASHPGGLVFEVDLANRKIKAYRQKDPAAAGGADIALPEVANAVNLSTSVLRCLVRGDNPNS